MSHKMVLEKLSQRRLNTEVIKRNIDGIISRTLAGGRARQGWSCSRYEIPSPEVKDNCYLYKVELNFNMSKSSGDEKFPRLIEIASSACSTNGKWSVVSTDGNEVKVIEPKQIEKLNFSNVQFKKYFEEIYEREAQIEIIHSSLEAFEQSKRMNRFHTVLYGPPGSGKTDILRCLTNMLGNDAVLKIDGTATTKAGIEKILLGSEYDPQVLVIEEIEKQKEEAYQYLLALLDIRSEIRKLNYRIGLSVKEHKMLCFATVNNITLFKSVMSGAIASRFANHVFCPRPTPELMEKILRREVRKVNGKIEWIRPTIEYCIANNETDPRKATAICLCGRDKLLTGKYQRYLDAVKPQDAADAF